MGRLEGGPAWDRGRPQIWANPKPVHKALIWAALSLELRLLFSILLFIYSIQREAQSGRSHQTERLSSGRIWFSHKRPVLLLTALEMLLEMLLPNNWGRDESLIFFFCRKCHLLTDTL